MFGYKKKKNRVAPEVILEQMRQQAAERRRGEGPPPVRDAWAPVLAESGTRVGDIRVEFEQDDPQRVWRLETLLEEARKEANKQRLWNEILHDSQYRMGVKIGEHGREIESLQEENERLQQEIERLRGESAVAQENERLRAELLLAAKAADLAVTAAAKVAKLVEGLEVALSCPISHGLLQDPVVSKVSGQTYSREDIEKWLKTSSNCPLTGLNMTRKHLVKNYAFGSVLDAFKAYQPPAAAPLPQEKPAQ
jgi:hypothetical protein